MLMTRMKTGPIESCLKNSYQECGQAQHKRRETILEDVKFKCQFQPKGNEANAKQQLSTSGWHS